ncbi:glycosidase related protein [Spirochaeta thermophila DSM 6578]|uniref:Glycosidase related protein n=1 Tax=Winmispira thermophila (strain ATCC 700085 / DSM 6578 / Z-1203) TaxID=869211 RepID=G0GCK0_WINT7|nr:glycoside hydrolase family 130 protein [Spirochaeta thermophila]AEJ62066.1 glycosidase related protein [Spirochaeta thermophila DSM 6578]
MERHPENPLIRPEDVSPSTPEYEVVGAFNPGAVKVGDEYLLLLRVAERVRKEEGWIRVPHVEFREGGNGIPSVLSFREDDPDVRLKDTRGVVYKGVDYLSTMSHIRLARSRDGVHFTVEKDPFLFPASPAERFGVEDARVVYLEGRYWITFTVVSPDGWATALASTTDFRSVERHGIIFHPQNKDVCIFPEKIRGRYAALHRPNNEGFGKPSIWYAESPDLLHWGAHSCLARPRPTVWEAMKIGGGAPSIRTTKGWLQIYHAKGEGQRYTLFALLLDHEDPRKIIARGTVPLMEPEAPYEKEGFFGNVLFTNGIIAHEDGTLSIYYGAADQYTCLVRTGLEEVFAHLEAHGDRGSRAAG